MCEQVAGGGNFREEIYKGRGREEGKIDSEPGPCLGLSSPKAKHQLLEGSGLRVAFFPYLEFPAP